MWSPRKLKGSLLILQFRKAFAAKMKDLNIDPINVAFKKVHLEAPY